jgi:hypothetical protein
MGGSGEGDCAGCSFEQSYRAGAVEKAVLKKNATSSQG